MNHTPGPWKMKQVTETHGRYTGSTYRYIITEDPTDCIAEIFPSRSPATFRANARLIAESPKLLELLMKLRRYDHDRDLWGINDEIDAAIANVIGNN